MTCRVCVMVAVWAAGCRVELPKEAAPPPTSWSVSSSSMLVKRGGPRPGELTLSDDDTGPPPHWRSTSDGPAVSWRVTGRRRTIVQSAQAQVSIRDSGRFLRLTANDGRAWVYGPLAAWGVDASSVPVRFEPEPHGWSIAVPDVEQGPVWVDPVLRTATFSAAFTADSAAGIGDINGDGFDDIAAGAVGGTTSTPGRVVVWTGSASGPDPLLTSDPTPTSATWQYGQSIAGNGDLNHDGYADLVVGGGHRAWIHYGAATGLGGVRDPVDDPFGGTSSFGYSVAIVGDLDGDSVDDLVVGDPSWNSSQGAVHRFGGTTTGVSLLASESLEGGSAGEWFGVAVAGAGDVNGDGYDDLVVGAHAWSGIAGRAYLFTGATTGLSSSADTTLSGGSSLDNFGRAVDGAGDVNQDGYDDVVIGAFNGSGGHGMVVVHHGSSAGLDTTAATTVVGPAYGAKFGQSVAALGDVDGDGYPDVAMGGHGTTTQAGVHHGGPLGVDARAVPALTGGVTLGKIVDGAGDVNGDGLAELLVVDPGAGTVELHFGGLDLDGDGWIRPEDCDDTDSGTRGGITVWTDADGDGFGDPLSELITCNPTADQVSVSGDCDDFDADVHPDALELPGDRTDSNCDGIELCFVDEDGDGVLSDAAATVEVSTEDRGLDCTTSGHVGADGPWGDCNDLDASVRPGIDELCNSEDTNCDGVVDAPAPESSPQWAPDADADGVPAEEPLVHSCESPEGHLRASSWSDCDDSDPDVFPGAPEVAGDAIDQDCDGADLASDRPPVESASPEAGDQTSGASKSGCSAVSTSAALATWLAGLAAAGRRTRARCGSRATSRRTPCDRARSQR